MVGTLRAMATKVSLSSTVDETTPRIAPAERM